MIWLTHLLLSMNELLQPSAKSGLSISQTASGEEYGRAAGNGQCIVQHHRHILRSTHLYGTSFWFSHVERIYDYSIYMYCIIRAFAVQFVVRLTNEQNVVGSTPITG